MLSPFEYVVVLTSIILGMGITQLITGIASIVLRWKDVKLYWPHMVLILLIFVIHIQDWWATYALRNNTSWNLPMFLFIILYPVNLYILARILFPIKWTPVPFDLKAFFFENFRKIYLFMVFLPVHSLIENFFLRGYGIKDQVVQLVLIATLGSVVVTNRKEEWIHQALAVLFIILCIASMVIGWNEFVIAA
ncbi:MAG TPA: hypothetical protein VFE50_18820 [Cyclobacteriaceae bacterium]|nr:hypothetical protein [Cyclobacteriaceae bacterium]